MKPLHIALLLFSAIALDGCFFSPREVKRLPDAPVMIDEIRGNYALAFSYSPQLDAMVLIGWVDLREYKGWTFSKFDWASYIQERKSGK